MWSVASAESGSLHQMGRWMKFWCRRYYSQVPWAIQNSKFKIQNWGLRAVNFPLSTFLFQLSTFNFQLSTFISYKTPVTGASFHQSRKAEERSLKTNLSVEMPIGTRFRSTVAWRETTLPSLILSTKLPRYHIIERLFFTKPDNFSTQNLVYKINYFIFASSEGLSST